MPKQDDYAVYEIANQIWVTELTPGYPIIHLSNNHGKVTVALHGAHVIDYTPVDQKPVIFTSQEALYREGKAIRGGIPICWPWFNAHPSDDSQPSHGYARNQFWKITGSNHSAEVTSVTLELTQNELKATATISLTESLEVTLTTTNLSERNQTIGGALHSYFSISDIEKVSISGLEDTHFIDTTSEPEETHVEDSKLSINQETDRIYLDTSESVSILDPEWNRSIIIDKTGSRSTVVWNPWIEKSIGMKDLGNLEYRDFVCIEAANARADVYELAPKDSHILSTKITVV